MKHEFEATIRKLTEPINGQYPRPWMTEMKNPWEAEVFIVGMNQRNGYDVDRVGTLTPCSIETARAAVAPMMS